MRGSMSNKIVIGSNIVPDRVTNIAAKARTRPLSCSGRFRSYARGHLRTYSIGIRRMPVVAIIPTNNRHTHVVPGRSARHRSPCLGLFQLAGLTQRSLGWNNLLLSASAMSDEILRDFDTYAKSNVRVERPPLPNPVGQEKAPIN